MLSLFTLVSAFIAQYHNDRPINTTYTVTRLGVVIFPGFASLDVSGPLQFFHLLSAIRPFESSIIAKTMHPVSTKPPESMINMSEFRMIGEEWMPTHTFDNAPKVDILLIPGGSGVRDKTICADVASFIKKMYPSVKYIFSVCTGAKFVADAGILDGRNATTNKRAWSFATANEAVHWIPKARWVVDGNIWTSSGVAAGMDMTYAFISTMFSPTIAQELANAIEYEPHTNANWDPFSDIWHVSS